MNVAVVENGVLYYVRTDHIGRPVFATDDAGVKVWTASYKPFGCVEASSGPNSDLRFPGQWFQSETGLHQNWMRDYDPTTGRYIQADPLGLVDGAAIYGYALQNPGRYTDFMGLEVNMCCRRAQIAGGLVRHCWVTTDTKSAGMGANPNIRPGDEYEGWGIPVQITDHSQDTPTECTVMNDVDEQCVNEELIIGAPLGRFTPPDLPPEISRIVM